jgi:hypothetical protein
LIGGKLNSIADGDSPRRDPIGGHPSCTPPCMTAPESVIAKPRKTFDHTRDKRRKQVIC